MVKRQERSRSSWQTTAEWYFSGALAGGIDSFFTMPFDTLKTQMQLNKQLGTSLTGCFKQIIRNDGFRGLYNGFPPFFTMAAGKASVRWGSMHVLETCVDTLGFNRKANISLWTILCGLGAGFIEAIIWTGPAERLKVLRQQFVGTGSSSFSYASIFATHGVKGMWVGIMPTALRSGTNAAIRFTAASHIKEAYRILSGTPEGQTLPFYASFMAGGTGGALSTVMNNPVDVVKTKIQAGFQGGMVSCWRAIIAERGVRGLFSGISARVPQIFLSQAIQFTVVDQLIPYLKQF